MTLRSQLETRIAEELIHLSPENAQRVAEDYVRIRFSERFPKFDFRAFSPEGKSRGGWPDAWILQNGQVDGVEATCAKEKSAVKKHLEEYLVKMQQRKPKLAGFVHVSVHPRVQFLDEEISTWRRRFVDEAGISPDRLDLVFGGGLIEILARPEFVRTRIELLGLDDIPKYFKLVRSDRGPDEKRLDSDFVPSHEDYIEGRVHRPEAANAIEAQLTRDHCSLVRGVGASGKSVLAWLLALEFAERRCPAFYLDLADNVDQTTPGMDNALIEGLKRFGHPQVLFILDNCHLNEALAKEMILAHRDMESIRQPRLLLLGREMHTSRGSLIDGLNIRPILLRALQPEVLGVYRRLAARKKSDGKLLDPPKEVLDDWVAVFGGDPLSPDTTTDLIAFSAAVRKRMKNLRSGDWKLSEKDAIEQIREVYLHPQILSEGETSNLMRLCVLQEVEMALSENGLVDNRAGLENCNRKLGIVFSHLVAGQGGHIRFRLAHAALGRLILAASFDPVDRKGLRHTIALQDPHLGGALIVSLLQAGFNEEARDLAIEIVQHPNLLLEMGSLNYLLATLHVINILDVPFPPLLGKQLAAEKNRRQLTERALETPLHFLANFLGYAAKAKELRPVFAAIASDLAEENNRMQLTERALETPLHFLANFLGYAAKAKELRPVFTALASDLAEEKNRKKLTERALETPLHFLAKFLGYAVKAKELRPVFTALASDLVEENNQKQLTERVLDTPLGGLASFLDCAAKIEELRPVFTALASDLAEENNRNQLTERALETPLGDLASFLDYAAKVEELNPAFMTLVKNIAEENNRKLFAAAMAQQSLDAVIAIIRSNSASKLWKKIFSEIDVVEWNNVRQTEEVKNLDAFVSFWSIAEQLGRPELAKAPALRLINASGADIWHRPTINLRHLSQVLRLGRGASPDIVKRFMEKVATSQWVDKFIKSTKAGPLAGNLLGFAAALEPEFHGWFQRKALKVRIENELASVRMYNIENQVSLLSLVGAAAAIGVTVSLEDADWPVSADLERVIESRRPSEGQEAIQPMQITLWLGLREMARLKSDPTWVSPTLADHILELYIALESSEPTEQLPNHVRKMNTAMIGWLEYCRAVGWRLVPPQNIGKS